MFRLKFSVRIVSLAIVCIFVLSTGVASASVLDWIETSVDPDVDGMVTTYDEWLFANAAYNDQEDGSYYAQWKRDWTATSSSGNTVTYEGVTLFDLHNIDSAVTQDSPDYNVFEYALIGGDTIKAWVFANDDTADDSSWLVNSGLAGSAFIDGNGNIDDSAGFIVRLNDDASTDVRWTVGMLMPGDVGFNWEDYYGFFGMAGFNNSAFDQGLIYAADGENEVYEVALYGEAFGTGSTPFVPCSTDLARLVTDPDKGIASTPLVTQMEGISHVNVPAPAAILLSGFGTLIVSRRRIR